VLLIGFVVGVDYLLILIEWYVDWWWEDGLYFDLWICVYECFGGEIV